MLSKALTQSLLRIVQSAPEREAFAASAMLRAFAEESGIGILIGKQVLFPPTHKDRLRAWLLADQIDPTTAPEAWSGVGRAEALAIGPDEKWAGQQVRAQRVALKTLGGKPLMVGESALHLPAQSNLEWLVADAARRLAHDAVIVVENWETFDRIDDLEVDFAPAGANPLVIWRGGGLRATTGAAMQFLAAYGRPVWSAPDYDPEGLAIASRFPHLVGILTPSFEILSARLEQSRLSDRYRQQLPGAQATLDSATNPEIIALWRLVRRAGKALPQEMLCHRREIAPNKDSR